MIMSPWEIHYSPSICGFEELQHSKSYLIKALSVRLSCPFSMIFTKLSGRCYHPVQMSVKEVCYPKYQNTKYGYHPNTKNHNNNKKWSSAVWVRTGL
jgi:hypothetical protein